MNNYKTNKSVFFITFTIFVFGIFMRVYNINYENFWFDEILSFWIADPTISFMDSWERHQSIEQVPFLYNFLLKILFKIFGYEIFIGRYLSLIFNILGIICVINISKLIKNNNSYILCLFLLCFNVYLIIYSQELRAYSLIFFLCSLSIYFFFKLMQPKKNQKLKFGLLVGNIISQILMIISHPFSLIVYFSIIIFIIIKYFKFKETFKELNYSIFIISIFTIFYLFFYIVNTESYPGWLGQPTIKFYTNFYFSTFFGSRIVGLFYLVSLISLIFFFKKKFKKEIFSLNFFLILFFLSYFLPLMFGYLFKPIIFHRYIIFVLIPIIVLISILIFEINNQAIRNTVITILLLLTIGNLYTESIVQQFIKKRPHYKPEFIKLLNEINQSKEKNYTFNLSFPQKTEKSAFAAIENYILKLTENKNTNIKYLEQNKFINSNKKKIWAICLPIIMNNKCNVLEKKLNSEILLSKNFSAINLVLIKKKE